MTNKIEEIKELIEKAVELKEQGWHNYYLGKLSVAIDQLDLRTEKDLLKIELADIVFDYFTKLRVANNWHEVLTAINEKCKQIQDLK